MVDYKMRAGIEALAGAADPPTDGENVPSLPLSIDDQRRLILLLQLQKTALIRAGTRNNWLEQQLATCANRGRHDLTAAGRDFLAQDDDNERFRERITK